jgi:hypothetical protein
MRVATVTLPSKWEPCKSLVRQCLECYTLLALPQFQVNVRCDGKSGRIQISDLGGLDEEQDWILKFAVRDFNLRIKSDPSHDPCKVALEFRKELDKRRNRQAGNSRNVLRGKVTSSADRG